MGESDGFGSHNCQDGSSGTADNFWDGSCTYPSQTHTQSSGGNETRPKNVYLAYIIKH